MKNLILFLSIIAIICFTFSMVDAYYIEETHYSNSDCTGKSTSKYYISGACVFAPTGGAQYYCAGSSSTIRVQEYTDKYKRCIGKFNPKYIKIGQCKSGTVYNCTTTKSY